MAERSKFAKSLRSPWQWIGVGVVLSVLAVIALAPIFDPPRSHSPGPYLLEPQFINLMMFSYAMDNGGKYPVGKSSTEVFQKLLDEKYCSDPSVFYLEMPGKTKPTSSKLKPENVCWDITVPLDDHDSDFLPVVFLTGYKIQYFPGGDAAPISASLKGQLQGISVGYKNHNTKYLKNDGLSDGIVSSFISKDFDPAGKKYQQLTPDGPLP